MSEPIQVSDLAIGELCELLAEEGTTLNEEQARHLADFIAKVGGLENALSALDLLPKPDREAA